MHHPNADAPPDGLPRRAAPPGQPPRPAGAPEGAAATTGGRARASGHRMPPTMLSGYEQILAARAAMRAEVERATAVERLGLLAPVLALAERDPRRARRRAEPRRRPGLILCGLAAAPVCALLALAWVEPPRTPGAPPAEPALVAGISPSALDVAAATATVPAARGPDDAPSWTAEAEPEAPRGNDSPEPDARSEHAEVEPAPPPVEHAGPALAARSLDAPPPSIEAEPAEPQQSEASRSVLDRAETEEETAVLVPAAVAEAEEEPAAAVEAAETADDGAGAEAMPVAAASDAAGAFPDTTDADAAGLQARQEAPPAEARTETKPALPPVKLAAPAEPPPLPPSVRAAPIVNRAGEPPPAPPARTVRAADGASPPAEARCRAIVVKFQLGEETSHADRTYLQTSCGARRR